MNTSTTSKSSLQIRPLQYRDLNTIAILLQTRLAEEYNSQQAELLKKIQKYQSYYGLLQILKILPSSFNRDLYIYIAERDEQIQGFISVIPANHTRTTWKVEQIMINSHHCAPNLLIGNRSIGSQLLRYCFEKIWEARTWILEVNINEKDTIGLYRENGFQPIAQMTYWQCNAEILQKLVEQQSSLPNLLPVSNTDSKLIYQLDCVSMPPMLRQIFDRHIEDFKVGFWQYLNRKLRNWFSHVQTISAYVFEPQRKAAIGYFNLQLSKNASQPHEVQLIVHPAYTWLYPKLLTKMAELVQPYSSQPLLLSSSDYQPEREEYLEKLGACRKEHNLLMSRSVWHKLREAKTLDFSLPEVLKGLKPAHTPIPTPWTKTYWAEESQSKPSEHKSSE